MEHAVQWLLIIGGAAAALLLLSAVLLSLAERRPLAGGLPGRLAVAGMMVLILTPVGRVVGSIVVYARLGDRRYVIITATVFALMLAGFLLGRG